MWPRWTSSKNKMWTHRMHHLVIRIICFQSHMPMHFHAFHMLTLPRMAAMSILTLSIWFLFLHYCSHYDGLDGINLAMNDDVNGGGIIRLFYILDRWMCPFYLNSIMNGYHLNHLMANWVNLYILDVQLLKNQFSDWVGCAPNTFSLVT